MPKRIQWNRHKIFAVAYLLTAIIAGSFVSFCEPGKYGGFIRGNVAIMNKDIIFFKIQSDTKERWYWMRPENHKYKHVLLICEAPREKTIHIELSQNLWRSNNECGELKTESLGSIIAGVDFSQSSNSKLREQMNALIDILHQLRNGEFKPPKHHRYSLENPIDGSIVHYTLGISLEIFVYISMILMWPIYLFIFRPNGLGRLTPVKTFLGTFVLVYVLILLFYGIDRATGLGGVSEFMEFLLGVLIFAVYPDFLTTVLGALFWADIASIIVILSGRKTDQKD